MRLLTKSLVVALLFAAFAANSAHGNGGAVITDRYEGELKGEGGSCRFTVELQADMFHLLTVGNKYRVIRIKVNNLGKASVGLSQAEDKVTLSFRKKNVSGIIDLKGRDPELWDKLLDDKSRHDVAYPQSIPAGEEQSIFIFVPIEDAQELPQSISYEVHSQSRPVTIEHPREQSKN